MDRLLQIKEALNTIRGMAEASTFYRDAVWMVAEIERLRAQLPKKRPIMCHKHETPIREDGICEMCLMASY